MYVMIRLILCIDAVVNRDFLKDISLLASSGLLIQTYFETYLIGFIDPVLHIFDKLLCWPQADYFIQTYFETYLIGFIDPVLHIFDKLLV